MVEQQSLLDGLALMGQATVLYAAPNTGKTLLVLWLLIQAIKEGRVDPSLVFYINCDDSADRLGAEGRARRSVRLPHGGRRLPRLRDRGTCGRSCWR